MREVSAFFGVTLPSVGKVYRQLEREGLLVRKRSSVTELAPLKTGRPVVHRGIVAVPIWLPGFLMFSDWREFFIELEQQLRRHNFVANLIFFRQGEDESPDFAQRVLGHEPESMVRLAPIPTMAFQMICEAAPPRPRAYPAPTDTAPAGRRLRALATRSGRWSRSAHRGRRLP